MTFSPQSIINLAQATIKNKNLHKIITKTQHQAPIAAKKNKPHTKTQKTPTTPP